MPTASVQTVWKQKYATKRQNPSDATQLQITVFESEMDVM